jgi:hypothetical protein
MLSINNMYSAQMQPEEKLLGFQNRLLLHRTNAAQGAGVHKNYYGDY